jgi:hypothetical protein
LQTYDQCGNGFDAMLIEMLAEKKTIDAGELEARLQSSLEAGALEIVDDTAEPLSQELLDLQRAVDSEEGSIDSGTI